MHGVSEELKGDGGPGGTEPIPGSGLLLFQATQPPRLPPAAFASFGLSRSTDSEKITLPRQETRRWPPAMARSGVSCGLASGLACPLPSPSALTSSLSGKAPCMRAREGISAPPSCERTSLATGLSHQHSPTQPEIAAGGAEGTALSPHRPSLDRKRMMQTRGCWLSALPSAQHRSGAVTHRCPKAPAPPGKPPAPLGLGLRVPALRLALPA